VLLNPCFVVLTSCLVNAGANIDTKSHDEWSRKHNSGGTALHKACVIGLPVFPYFIKRPVRLEVIVRYLGESVRACKI
jgi:hypothetical protein